MEAKSQWWRTISNQPPPLLGHRRQGFAAELRGSAWVRVGQRGQEAAACHSRWRDTLSAVVVVGKGRAAALSLLAWDRRGALGDRGLTAQTWGWGSPLVVLSHSCSTLGRSSTVFYRRNGLCLTRLGAGCFLNQPGECPSVSSFWAQRWCAPCCHMPGGRAGEAPVFSMLVSVEALLLWALIPQQMEVWRHLMNRDSSLSQLLP